MCVLFVFFGVGGAGGGPGLGSRDLGIRFGAWGARFSCIQGLLLRV